VRFEPSGWTGNRKIPYAKSIVDYIFRWLGIKFLGPEYSATEETEISSVNATETDRNQSSLFGTGTTDAPLCVECGSIMSRNGSCYKCGNCGDTSGCS
jgi:ribonucleoside-diphosphate reductase alpha chain